MTLELINTPFFSNYNDQLPKKLGENKCNVLSTLDYPLGQKENRIKSGETSDSGIGQLNIHPYSKTYSVFGNYNQRKECQIQTKVC